MGSEVAKVKAGMALKSVVVLMSCWLLGCAYKPSMTVSDAEPPAIDSYSRVLVMKDHEYNLALLYHEFGSYHFNGSWNPRNRKEKERYEAAKIEPSSYYSELYDYTHSRLVEDLSAAGVDVVGMDTLEDQEDLRYEKDVIDYFSDGHFQGFDFIIVSHRVKIKDIPDLCDRFVMFPCGQIMMLSLGILPIDFNKKDVIASFDIYEAGNLAVPLDTNNVEVKGRSFGSLTYEVFLGYKYDQPGFRSAADFLVREQVKHLQGLYIF